MPIRPKVCSGRLCASSLSPHSTLRCCALTFNYVGQAYFQIFCDLCFTSAIVYFTGGIDSYFPFLYSLSIIMASILLYRKGALITAQSLLPDVCRTVFPHSAWGSPFNRLHADRTEDGQVPHRNEYFCVLCSGLSEQLPFRKSQAHRFGTRR